MANEKKQSIRERIAQLEKGLPIAVKERRRRFLEACAYYNIAQPKEPPLNESDTRALDHALDNFFEAAKLVNEIRREIKGKNEALELAASKGVNL